MCSSSLSLAEFLEACADAERGGGKNINADIYSQRAQEAREQSQLISRLEQENSRLQVRLDNVDRAFKAV